MIYLCIDESKWTVIIVESIVAQEQNFMKIVIFV